MKIAVVAFFVIAQCGAFAPAHYSRTVTSSTLLGAKEKGGTSKELDLPCADECAISKYPNLPESIHPGVLSGQAQMDLLNHAKEHGYAIPAVNCVSNSGINACLEAARKNDAPIIIQFSSGGSQFYGGKGLDNSNYRAAIAGAVSGAFHVRTMAEQYGVPVILHTDHCAKKLLPWIDGLLSASERYYEQHGEPLFSSHMIDLSEEPIEENIEICKEYLTRMDKIGILLEMELGITGGEEDGVDNSDRPIEDLYSKPEEIYQVYEELMKISDKFTVAAAFGNVHGVYSPGNVKLEPKILSRAQDYISEKLGDKAPADKKPVAFVFHGGSGSDVADIQEAIGYGVIKMNIDTDTQWSYWEGIKNFETKYHDYLQTQIGNPDGPDKPNKKYYDPRESMRAAEVNTVARLGKSYADLKCQNILGLGEVEPADNVLGPRRGGLPV
ncbi:fructose-1,6-bisphosphate aldolase [Phaeodactylum tricornutum CCAP 1055/1]|jgi:fructose-bisphosphate aldolase class II|uniref:fructose-bisphosphate aldolase n=2 Tax=Phaeodactylum tricornutum TaxID=2850 RepID=B7G9G9_PHATC|nr:fructose-1,6-bisphosphate aldolase [Phaeodactylum tricornutum CCAP 1055/1]EEC44953.1 fructose-1,6-bisphosphate aldolase [Phaeodactylum tricornutum CCAP 1055/1]|eukprot:XP_002183771.1 fructose-1,6-bisphosphate aldolase [Phaeodactylum tricornutum CCAP 1055/1]